MKKSVLIISLAFILMSGTNLSAQKKWYVSFDAGYAFKMSSQNLYDLFGDYFFNSTEHYDARDYNSSGKNEQINVSLGKGTNFKLAAGYMFSKHFGVELGVSYLLGGKTKAKNEYFAIYQYYDPYSGVDYYDYSILTEKSISSMMLRINPSVLFCAGFEKVNPYAKFGMIIGMGSIFYDYSSQRKYEDYYEDEAITQKVKMNKGIALGCNAALGVMFNIGERISLFGEVNTVAMSYAPKKGVITEYTENGKDRLPYLTTSEKEIDFVNSYSYSSEDETPDYEPSKGFKYKYPFGSIGLNVGIIIRF